jgi:hypothetical protein
VTGLFDPDGQLDIDLLAYDEAQHAGHTPGVWPSDVKVLTPGRGCRKQIAYRVAGTPPTDKVPDWLTRAALAGSAVHEVIEKARAHSHPTWWLERRVRVPGFDRDGRLDAYMDDTATVDDIKTKGERPFDTAVHRGRPDDPDRDQVLLYGLAVEALGAPVRRCSVSYVNRSTLETHVESWTYDRREAEDVAIRMFTVLDEINTADPDSMPRDGRAPMWSPCDTCPFRARCWDLPPDEDPAEVFSARALPETVAAAAEALIRLRAEAAENDATQEWCKAVLRGHHGAEFTDDEDVLRRVHWSRSIEPGQGGKLDTAEAKRILIEMGIPVPTLGQSPRLTFPTVKKK